MDKLNTSVMTEDEFRSLRDGGFFSLILKHPQFEVYDSRSNGSLVVHIPQRGMVEIEMTEQELKELK